MGNAWSDVLAEMARQDEKWGEQNHDLSVWLPILLEEVGEFCQALLHKMFGGPAADNVRTEAVQVAAVAMAMLESLDRVALRDQGAIQ